MFLNKQNASVKNCILVAICALMLCHAGCSGKKTEELEEGVTLVKVAFWGTPEKRLAATGTRGSSAFRSRLPG